MAKPLDWRRTLPPLILWGLLVLFFSTRTEVRGEPFVWIPITWAQALKISLAQWSAWGVLALIIVWIDRRLPIEKDALVRRFLFNALNAVSAHVESDPRMARLMLERLGDLLRLSLDHVDKYLKLQAMRFEDRLSVSMNLDPTVLEALVPPFILQPLVENAVRHGAAARSADGTIVVEAWRDNGSVRLAVRDNGPGLPVGWSDERHEGIGLANTRERLRQLYGEANQSLTISPQPEGGVRVDLMMPFRCS